MTGAEVAWRTLSREPVQEPCIIGAWMMKRDFFRRYAGITDIYANPVETAVEAFASAGCNLNPQFIMPSPFQEHLACDPFNIPTEPWKGIETVRTKQLSPEDVRDDIDAFLSAHTNDAAYDITQAGNEYAERLVKLRNLSRDRTLYIGHFAMPAFMSGYSKWTYESYLSALILYPDHFKAYFMALAQEARFFNQAIAEAVKNHDIAPFVYNGDDICFNDGPICSLGLLDDLYFPALKLAIEPLIANGIEMIWHCDGNVLPIAQRLIDAGIGGFQGFQELEADIPFEKMAALKRKDGGKLIFFGSISVVHTFPFGTVGDVKRDVERCYDLAGPGGGFCLAPSSSILPETPIENIEAFFEHGCNYGRSYGRKSVSERL
jgi:hypothetical protein